MNKPEEKNSGLTFNDFLKQTKTTKTPMELNALTNIDNEFISKMLKLSDGQFQLAEALIKIVHIYVNLGNIKSHRELVEIFELLKLKADNDEKFQKG